jgi:hypothetical protein
MTWGCAAAGDSVGCQLSQAGHRRQVSSRQVSRQAARRAGRGIAAAHQARHTRTAACSTGCQGVGGLTGADGGVPKGQRHAHQAALAGSIVVEHPGAHCVGAAALQDQPMQPVDAARQLRPRLDMHLRHTRGAPAMQCYWYLQG